ncbi:unnamed protein product [Pelagomonas calceolata]|uniref:RING-CH-type domain-containing protein n=2 Tax=Pelagomonas calceolata TaxID=35677 RepID=A0A8J2X2S6_9STRA|nr:unnamed protein product [Pelagomonas calceolata]
MAAPAADRGWLHDADLAAQKSNEAVAVAAEKCADDTKGQTCYICTEALHWKTKEGLVRMCSCRGTAGFVHVSCLAEQAKILVAEAEENNLDWKVRDARWKRWYSCSLCEQRYQGVVQCALGWACWKTYVGRPEGNVARSLAMTSLGNGLSAAEHHEDALTVREAELAMKRRLGASEASILVVQGNLGNLYDKLGRLEQALQMRQDAYSGHLKFYGEEHEDTVRTANNYAASLYNLQSFEEAKLLLRRTVPVARRVFGDDHRLTLSLGWMYAMALYLDEGATLDDTIESVNTLEELERTARRVLGGAHPLTTAMEDNLRQARAALREEVREEARTRGAAIIYAAAALAVAAVLVLRKKLT